jgi:hypothetical protein
LTGDGNSTNNNNRMTGKGVPELDAAAAAGDDFVVDYVRVYDIVE